ncbi:MAG: LuxR C-terminal-related transcriptional regulator [Anaerolineae bacterium]|jgi:DNA-binding CsgD family transcriptional regulator|nr:LuxR C-terminal-related transcriptional regulator [Anaerolineae bacterium]
MNDLGPLSEREIEVMKLVALGKTNQQIARDLSISPNTVKVHLRNIFEKLGVQSRTEATMEAVRRGWVSVGEVAPVPADESADQDHLATAGEMANANSATLASATVSSPPKTVEPVPYRPPIARWQRVYMVAIGVLFLLALLAPIWWQNRSQAATVTPFSDVGQVQMAPAARPKVSRWIGRAPLPEPADRLALASDGSKLYTIGGETASGITDRVTIYDPRSNGWAAGASKPTPVANANAIWLRDRIYVPGGTTVDGMPTDAVEVYDPKTDTWEARAALPFPLAAYGSAGLNGRLHLFGGWDGTRYLADTLIYDPETDSWSVGMPMAEPRAFLAASSLQDHIYVVGGYDGQRELATVAAYDPAGEGTAAGPWSSRAPLSQPRGGLGLVALGQRLYAVGGGWTEPLAFNEQYDIKTGAWSRIETPAVGQWRNLALAALGNKLYAVGGWNGSYLGTNEEYQALLQQLLPLFTRGE